MISKIKVGMTPSAIVAMVFSILGGIYTILGVCLRCFPEDPDDRIAGFVFLILGIVFLVVSVILCGFFFANKKRLQAIRDSGRYVLGEITDITTNYYVRVNSRNPYVILVKYTDARGNIHIFKSTNQTTYPDRSIIGKSVKIYYEDESFKKYYVDLEGVLPKVIEH